MERIIWSSIASPKKWSEGKYIAPVFDAKENIADKFWANAALKEKLSVLLVGFYVLNALHQPKFYCPSKVGVPQKLCCDGHIAFPPQLLDSVNETWELLIIKGVYELWTLRNSIHIPLPNVLIPNRRLNKCRRPLIRVTVTQMFNKNLIGILLDAIDRRE